MNTFTVLLRAIGPPTHKILTMSRLQALCQEAGLLQTRNVLATGNLVVVTPWPREQVAQTVEHLLEREGLKTVLLVRTLEQLESIVSANPLPLAAQRDPSQFQVTFLTERPLEENLERLRERARSETVERVCDEICIDYGGRISDSKLTAALVERLLRASSTARNWNTLLKLLAVARAMR